MTIRTTTRQATFTRPFTLQDVDDTLPPGTYAVDTDEEMIDSLSFIAWRRVATAIHVVRGGATEIWPVDPADLDEALRRDAET